MVNSLGRNMNSNGTPDKARRVLSESPDQGRRRSNDELLPTDVKDYRSTSKSRFQPINDLLTKSMRVVKFETGFPKDTLGNPTIQQRGQSDNISSSRNYDSDDDAPSWIAKVAFSFGSPQPQRSRHKRVHSSALAQYPHSVVTTLRDGEDQSLLSNSSHTSRLSKGSSRNVAIAVSFLRDFEANRPPSLSPVLSEITDFQLKLYQIKFGNIFSSILFLSSLGLFVSSILESGTHRGLLTLLNLLAVAIFSADVWIRHEWRGEEGETDSLIRQSRSRKLSIPIMTFGVLLVCESIIRFLLPYDDNHGIFVSSFLKPLILFYVSSRARDALEALHRIVKIVFKVIIMELLLILMFAAVACRLYEDYEQFKNLSTSWLSLFELATTVVNPSIWIPMYSKSKSVALFFIVFIVTSVFYLHSLVLSVVFQTYIRAASGVHERSAADREYTIHLAYLALKKSSTEDTVDTRMIRKTFEVMRPHYNASKIKALVDILDPTEMKYVDYPTFRTKIGQALNTSIRSARSASSFAVAVEIMSKIVAVSNFVYVILVSSTFDPPWFHRSEKSIGCVITLLASFDLFIRFNPGQLANFTPLTRLNAAFDGLACLGASLSLIGILMRVFGHSSHRHLLLTGRAIDMIRIMRFFRIFREVVRRSSDVLPALVGPTILVMSTLHVFVYIGIALWGGAIHVGAYDGIITPLYDLNNFNSYQEGLVTMFQVLVVNDWHAIAQVFLHADRCSSPYIVFPFFVAGNLIGVSIMLNVLTAFFVASFVTEIDDMEHSSSLRLHRREDHFASIHQSDGSSSHRANASTRRYARAASSDADESSESNELSVDSDSEYDFDVFEREGFDKIMQTVAGGAHRRDFARDLCQYLEIYEGLTPERDSVGYLICDQQTLERFGNRRFQVRAEGFLPVNELHVTVSEMHAELMQQSLRGTSSGSVLDAGARSVTRVFPHCDDPGLKLEISAALLREHPAVSLFVARHINGL